MNNPESKNRCRFELLIEMVRPSTLEEAGYIWAPYVPAFETPQIVMGVDPYEPSGRMTTAYATKTINSQFYGTVQFTGQ